jgi:penicillin G amidase
MKIIKANAKLGITFFVLIALVVVFSRQLFHIVPPIGKILDPFKGFIQNENERSLNTGLIAINGIGLSDSVNVFFDSRKVPHIYAKNEHDIFFAQGYIAAYFRLWQMDFMSYAAAGRLSEIFDKGFFNHDRYQRRTGMVQAAKESLKLIEKNAETSSMINAYTKGVNAFIAGLTYETMPLEYKMLDYKPEPWTNLKTVIIMKSMAAMLSGYEEDFSMTNIMLAFGEKKFNELYPGSDAHSTAIVNDLVPGVNPALSYIKKPEYLDTLFQTPQAAVDESLYNPAVGSNSWAVSGKKTKSKNPILCSDPHLQLSLPAIWLEMQLVAPGMNVYGVCIPGVPAVIIGFNEKIAWGSTNGNDDAKDWYKLKINEGDMKYRFDNGWLDLKGVPEEIKIKGKNSFRDTVYYTIHGPIVYDKSFPGDRSEIRNHALRWALHTPSNELLAFLRINRSGNYQDFKDALKHYSSPIQNFTFACSDNTIAVHHQGTMPVKWPGQGRFILDGTKSTHLYSKFIPTDSLPHLINPACSYVVAANQHPTNGNYPYYYNGYYKDDRSGRIQQLLQQQDSFDIQRMMAMQLDNASLFAVDALAELIKRVDISKLNESDKKTLQDLKTWKGEYNFDDEIAGLFESWWKYVREYTWDEYKTTAFSSRLPRDYLLLDFIKNDPGNINFDKQGTSSTENASDIITEAFNMATTDFDEQKEKGNAKWSNINKVHIGNIARINSFSRMNLPSAGNAKAINAMAGSVGPSWRMVVELGKRPTAYGIYPGGQSGSGGSPNYDNFVNDWINGKYYPLLFFMSVREAKEQAGTNWVLK